MHLSVVVDNNVNAYNNYINTIYMSHLKCVLLGLNECSRTSLVSLSCIWRETGTRPYVSANQRAAPVFPLVSRVVQYCRPDSSRIPFSSIGKPEMQMCRGLLMKAIYRRRTDSDGKVHVLFVGDLQKVNLCWITG